MKGQKMKHSPKKFMLFLLGSALAITMIGQMANAQPVPSAKNMLVRGGMLCGSQHDLEVLLTGISLNNGKFPEEMPESCGRFKPEQPVPMVITPLAWYETPMAKTLIAKFVHARTGWTQFGYVAYIPNPDFTPKTEG